MENRGKIENLKPWKKDQPSPNPKGRPRKSAITEALHEQLGQESPEDKFGRTYAEVISLKLIKLACKGDVRAIKELMDRTEGKAVQAVEHSGKEGGEPVVFTLRRIGFKDADKKN